MFSTTFAYKMKPKVKSNYILVCCVLVLVVLCFLSVNTPIRFKREQQRRELVVKQRLLKIRKAEMQYRRLYGVYTGSFGKLADAGLLADSLSYIPFAGGQRFDLTVSTSLGKSGRQIPLMECGATYRQYLQGLDANSITNLTEEANAAGRYPGLKIGDITTDNNNAGNWE